ncbi:unnamed protein product [Rhizophagus irregularis]|nr:unnamed protein product [Rhizophagus irregularis]
MEILPPEAYGLVSGTLQQGYAAGYIVAAIFYYLVTVNLGWRAFWIGSFPTLLIIIIASRIATMGEITNSGPLSNVRYLKTQLLFSPDFGFNLLFGLWISISFSFALRIGIYRLQSFVSDWYVSASTLDFGSVSA